MAGSPTPFLPSRRQLALAAEVGSNQSVVVVVEELQGHPDDMIENYSQQVRYKEPLLLFRHDGTRLVDVSAKAGPVFQKQFPARGLAIGDYNNDGRIDVLVGNNGGAPLLLKNNAGEGNHWIGVLTDVPIDRYVTIVEGQGRIKG